MHQPARAPLRVLPELFALAGCRNGNRRSPGREFRSTMMPLVKTRVAVAADSSLDRIREAVKGASLAEGYFSSPASIGTSRRREHEYLPFN
jgi:hypothetical protein